MPSFEIVVEEVVQALISISRGHDRGVTGESVYRNSPRLEFFALLWLRGRT